MGYGKSMSKGKGKGFSKGMIKGGKTKGLLASPAVAPKSLKSKK